MICLYDGNQVEDAQAHEAQAQQGAQAQRITRSMARVSKDGSSYF